jgi:hypothetical protein
MDFSAIPEEETQRLLESVKFHDDKVTSMRLGRIKEYILETGVLKLAAIVGLTAPEYVGGRGQFCDSYYHRCIPGDPDDFCDGLHC